MKTPWRHTTTIDTPEDTPEMTTPTPPPPTIEEQGRALLAEHNIRLVELADAFDNPQWHLVAPADAPIVRQADKHWGTTERLIYGLPVSNWREVVDVVHMAVDYMNLPLEEKHPHDRWPHPQDRGYVNTYLDLQFESNQARLHLKQEQAMFDKGEAEREGRRRGIAHKLAAAAEQREKKRIKALAQAAADEETARHQARRAHDLNLRATAHNLLVDGTGNGVYHLTAEHGHPELPPRTGADTTFYRGQIHPMPRLVRRGNRTAVPWVGGTTLDHIERYLDTLDQQQ